MKLNLYPCHRCHTIHLTALLRDRCEQRCAPVRLATDLPDTTVLYAFLGILGLLTTVVVGLIVGALR